MSESQPSLGSAEDPLTELAHRRRRLAEEESTRPRPSFIQSVEQSEVLFTLDSLALPYGQLNPWELTERLRSAFKVSLSTIDFSPLLAKVPAQQLASMDENERLLKLVAEPRSELRWENGQFPLRNDFVLIRSIRVNFESIHVSVAGVSQVAETIAEEVIEIIWDLVGAKKTFKDISSFILLTGYGTGTRVAMGTGPESLLNPSLMAFLEQNLTDGIRITDRMGRTRPNAEPEKESRFAVAALDDLILKVRQFDPSSGYSQESTISFSVTARNDYRSGRLLVRTALPYQQHVELLTAVFDAVRE